MNIFPLRKKSHEPLLPARLSLNDHLGIDAEIVRQLGLLNQRFTSADNDTRLADAMEADIAARREQIDGALANARYAQEPVPDLTQDRRALADLESRFKPVSETARAAKVLIPRLQADIAALAQRRAEHRKETPRLLWNATRELMAGHAGELAEAEAALRAVHRRAFVAATVADRIARSQCFGEFSSSALWHELNIPKPLHPAFYPDVKTPEAELALRRADAQALEHEADQLMAALLNPEA